MWSTMRGMSRDAAVADALARARLSCSRRSLFLTPPHHISSTRDRAQLQTHLIQ